ncbi:GIY-YIG nuclease family protein [Dactylosporangium sp. NPDC000244]|uniref:GIY-YIG nuclease family protein n=1 Tax=Dactylosporangium sp. NPDC000244 TaxID=3154365 RepID=UPI003330A09E
MNRRTGLYRLRKSDGTLLYIGIGYDPAVRITSHRRKSWGGDIDITKTTIEWFENRESAETAELAAIRDEQPIHNIVTGDENGCARFLPHSGRSWGRPAWRGSPAQMAALANARRLSRELAAINTARWDLIAHGRALGIPDTTLCEESGESRSTLNRRLGTRSGSA